MDLPEPPSQLRSRGAPGWLKTEKQSSTFFTKDLWFFCQNLVGISNSDKQDHKLVYRTAPQLHQMENSAGTLKENSFCNYLSLRFCNVRAYFPKLITHVLCIQILEIKIIYTVLGPSPAKQSSTRLKHLLHWTDWLSYQLCFWPWLTEPTK